MIICLQSYALFLTYTIPIIRYLQAFSLFLGIADIVSSDYLCIPKG